MTNTELTLDQLTAIAGGVVAGPNGETCTDRFTWENIKDIFGGRKSIVHLSSVSPVVQILAVTTSESKASN